LKRPSHTSLILAGITLVGGGLMARAGLPFFHGDFSSLSLLRIAVPAVLPLMVLVLLVNRALRASKVWLDNLELRAGLPTAIAYLLTLAVVALDILHGLPPYLLMPACVVFGMALWNRGLLLAILTVVAAGGLGTLRFVMAGAINLEDLTILGTALLLAQFSAETIRHTLAPTEERVRSLEAENRELWDLSYRDSLTAIFNRRYVQQIATQLFTRAVRYHEQLHVLMLDIDHFKRVNDKLGHAVGDEVLKAVAATIQAFVRSSDALARYGGEEFIVYIVQANPELVQFIANRIRDGVANLHLERVPWTVTISIGVAGLQSADTLDSLVERADKFLYKSKQQGRNRVSGF